MSAPANLLTMSLTHPECVLSFQEPSLKTGQLNNAVRHAEARARIGYTAVAFNPDNSLCKIVQKVVNPQRHLCHTVQALNQNAFVVSYHWGGRAGSGIMAFTERKGKTWVSTLRGRGAEAQEERLKELLERHEWLDSFLEEGYDQAYLPVPETDGVRSSVSPVQAWADRMGLEIDPAIAAGTTRFLPSSKSRLPSATYLARLLALGGTLVDEEPGATRHYGVCVYGWRKGSQGECDQLILEEGVDPLEYAQFALETYAEIHRLLTVYNGDAQNARPSSYQIAVWSNRTGLPVLKDESLFGKLFERQMPEAEFNRRFYPQAGESLDNEEVEQVTEQVPEMQQPETAEDHPSEAPVEAQAASEQPQ